MYLSIYTLRCLGLFVLTTTSTIIQDSYLSIVNYTIYPSECAMAIRLKIVSNRRYACKCR